MSVSTAEVTTLPADPRDAVHDLPAWPMLALFYGLPLWWASGLFAFCTVIMAVPMAYYLLRSPRLTWLPGYLPFVAFVLWMLPSVFLVESFGDLVGYGLRVVQFVTMALIPLYIFNAPGTLSTRRLLTMLVSWWVMIIAWGYAGMVIPDFRMTLTFGQLLPGSIRSNAYVQDLVFPPLAEIQTPFGADQPFKRPAAPFPYTNGWGSAMALLTPVAIAAAVERKDRRFTLGVLAGCILMIPPAVATSNRGFFLTLAVILAIATLRLGARGNFRALFGVTFAALGGTALLIAAGLFDRFAERQEAANTTEGRAGIYAETFQRTLDSPLIGYGAPRASFTSEISIGTQGMFWSVLFCFGFVGLALFLGFLVGAVYRTRLAPSDAAIWLNTTVAGSVVMSLYYGMDRQLIPLLVVIAVLLRERYLQGTGLWPAHR